MDERNAFRKHVILITGAAGFTGSHACRYFAAQGMQVAAVVRHIPNEPIVEGVKYYSCNLLDQQKLSDVINDVAPDFALHLGGKNSVPESWDHPVLYIETNVLSTFYLLNALRSFPACRILIAGSRTVFELSPPFLPPHPYSLSKSLQKASVLSWQKLFGQYIMLAEPSNLIGPGPSTGFCALLGRHIAGWEKGKINEAFKVSSRKTRRDFLDVRDAVKAYGVLLQRGTAGESYAVDSGRERTLGEMTEMFIAISGSNVPVEWEEQSDVISSDKTKRSLLQMEPLGWHPSIPISASLYEILEYSRNQEGDNL